MVFVPTPIRRRRVRVQRRQLQLNSEQTIPSTTHALWVPLSLCFHESSDGRGDDRSSGRGKRNSMMECQAASGKAPKSPSRSWPRRRQKERAKRILMCDSFLAKSTSRESPPDPPPAPLPSAGKVRHRSRRPACRSSAPLRPHAREFRCGQGRDPYQPPDR